MRKVLDKLFINKIISLIIPIAISVLLYGIFLIFKINPENNYMVFVTPIVTLSIFFTIFLFIFIIIKTPLFSYELINLVELFLLILFSVSTIVGIIILISSGFEDFAPPYCAFPLGWSAISWAHNYRKTPEEEILENRNKPSIIKTRIIVVISCIFFVSIFLLMLFKPIDRKYDGKHKELYTTAINSIPNVEGFMYHGEGAFDSVIYVWEKDEYGRTLFTYCEDYSFEIYSLVICHKYDNENVYFYPEVNYAIKLDTSNSVTGNGEDMEWFIKSLSEQFYKEQKDVLKEYNDWGQPINKVKCVSYIITNEKKIGKDVNNFSEEKCDQILLDYTSTIYCPNPETGAHRTNRILQIEEEGKILHEIFGLHRNYDNKENTLYITLWIITDAKGNYDKDTGILVMESSTEHEWGRPTVFDKNKVEEFKRVNGWSYKYCTE